MIGLVSAFPFLLSSSSSQKQNQITKKKILQRRMFSQQLQQQQQQRRQNSKIFSAMESSSSSSFSEQQQKQQHEPKEKQRRILSQNELLLEQKVPNDANDFPRTWIPIGSIYELNPNRPNEFHFLDNSYIVYCSAGTWIVMDNVCSHRLAPLSEGRIVRSTGIIECSYHGWSFNQRGECIHIPQIENQAIGTNNKKSCIRTYTVQMEKNILFVWLWSTDLIEYTTKLLIQYNNDINIVNRIIGEPKIVLNEIGYNSKTYTRDLPYGYDALLENLIDPAHVPWAHHGLQGTRDDAIPITMSNPIVNNTGFDFTFQDRTMKMKRSAYAKFYAPYVISYLGEYYTDNDNAIERNSETSTTTTTTTKPLPFNLTTICIPTKPGWSKIIICPPTLSSSSSSSSSTTTTTETTDSSSNTQSEATTGNTIQTKKVSEKQKQNSSKEQKVPFVRKLVFTLFSRLPPWIIHQLSNRFLDSDLAFLHYQNQEQRRRRSNHYNNITSSSSSSIESVTNDPANSTSTTTTIVSSSSSNNKTKSSVTDYYFMPGQCDRGVVAMYKWLQTYAKHVIEQPIPPPIYDRTILFNHYTQHTDQCQHCNYAYNILLPKYRRNIYGMIAISIPLSFMVAKSFSILTAIGIIALQLLKRIENSFVRGEFQHYNNH